MFPGRPARRRRIAGAVVPLIVAFLLPVASASALTVEGTVADAIAGSSGAPSGTVLTVFVSADGPGTRVPRGVTFAVGQGLQLGASGPSCDLATVRSGPQFCGPGSEVGQGTLETASRTFRLRAFTLSPSTLAVRIEDPLSSAVVDVTTASLDGSQQALTLGLPPSVRGEDFFSLQLRLGGQDPSSDWVRSTLCPNGAWSLQATLIEDVGTTTSGTASIGCRPARRPQLGKITPLFSLSQSRRNGRTTPLRLDAASLPAGLPADAVVHVTCRRGCRGSWRARVNANGSTRVRIPGGIRVGTPGLRLQVSVASRSIRGTYLVIAFTRGASGRVNGWTGVGRGCVKLGAAPARMACPR